MTTRIPMPSPRNSNYEKLYLTPRFALDIAPNARSAALGDLQQFHESLGPDAAAKAQQLLSRLLESLDAPDNDDDPDADQAQDRRRRGVTGDGRHIQRRAWVGDGNTTSSLARRFPLAKMPSQY